MFDSMGVVTAIENALKLEFNEGKNDSSIVRSRKR